MFEKHQEGGTVEDLRAMKEDALREVYRFLVLNFGVPPTEFEWRYQQTKREEGGDLDEEMLSVGQEGLTPLEHYTPQSFYRKFVSQPLSDFVCLYQDPLQAPNEHFKKAPIQLPAWYPNAAGVS